MLITNKWLQNTNFINDLVYLLLILFKGGDLMNIDEKINERYAQKTPLTDKSMIKGKDLDLFRQVVDYLASHDLSYEVKGSAQKNAERGLARNYNDIDILVNKSNLDNLDGRSYAIMDLTTAANSFMKKGLLESPDFMSHLEKQEDNRVYVDTTVEKSFIFARQNPKTKIDLNFERNISPVDDGYESFFELINKYSN